VGHAPREAGDIVKRRSPLRRTGRITPKKRSAADFQRVYGSTARVQWVQSQPCSVMACPRSPSETAHTVTGGMGRKADAATTIPLCAYHHAELHQVGTHSFEVLHRVPLAWLAAQTAEAWAAHEAQSGLVHVSEVVPGVLAAMQGERTEDSA
jgi:hypothetical protein